MYTLHQYLVCPILCLLYCIKGVMMCNNIIYLTTVLYCIMTFITHSRILFAVTFIIDFFLDLDVQISESVHTRIFQEECIDFQTIHLITPSPFLSASAVTTLCLIITVSQALHQLLDMNCWSAFMLLLLPNQLRHRELECHITPYFITMYSARSFLFQRTVLNAGR